MNAKLRTANVNTGYHHILDLARGGMGTVSVVLRREGGFERLYAMKRLRETFREDEGTHAMFLVEARVAGAVRHPNVVSVLDVGEDAEGPYLVMEYVDGISVAQLARRLRALEERLPLSLTLAIVAAAARGLHAAHQARLPDGTPQNIVHRDVSPQNLLVGFDGVVRVADFGVAKILGHLAQTQQGVLKGKLPYMAPEQLRFEDIDHRCDLFGLGVVLFELLAGERLYGSDGQTAARQILRDAPPDIGELRPGLPPELVALCFSLLAKQPHQRPESAEAVAQRLEAIGDDDPDGLNLTDYVRVLFEQDRATRGERIESGVRRLKAAADAKNAPASAALPSAASKTRLRWAGAGLIVLALAAGGYFAGARSETPARAESEADTLNAAASESDELQAGEQEAARPGAAALNAPGVNEGGAERAVQTDARRAPAAPVEVRAPDPGAPPMMGRPRSPTRPRREASMRSTSMDAEESTRPSVRTPSERPSTGPAFPEDDIWTSFD
ncbi:MAG: serine/threonine-protein kinase [Myxococcota bacterium]